MHLQSGFRVHVICINILLNSLIKGTLYFDRTKIEPDLKQLYIQNANGLWVKLMMFMF